MKNIILFSLISFLFSCNRNNSSFSEAEPVTSQDTLELKENIAEKLKLTIRNSEWVQHSNLLIYPVNVSNGNDRKDYIKSEGYYINEICNLLFYHLKTGEKYELFPDKQVIVVAYQSQPWFNESTSEQQKKAVLSANWRDDKLFYTIIDTDINQNGKLDSNDPHYLYMSDLDGKNLKKISPTGINMESWHFINAEKTRLELRGVSDTNGDKKYDFQDTGLVFIIDLSTDKTENLFPVEYQKGLEDKYILQGIKK
jgi:hypothetical protein